MRKVRFYEKIIRAAIKRERFIMHMLTGKWKIVAKTPLGEMDLVADFAASEDATTFTGSVFDEKQKKTIFQWY